MLVKKLYGIFKTWQHSLKFQHVVSIRSLSIRPKQTEVRNPIYAVFTFTAYFIVVSLLLNSAVVSFKAICTSIAIVTLYLLKTTSPVRF